MSRSFPSISFSASPINKEVGLNLYLVQYEGQGVCDGIRTVSAFCYRTSIFFLFVRRLLCLFFFFFRGCGRVGELVFHRCCYCAWMFSVRTTVLLRTTALRALRLVELFGTPSRKGARPISTTKNHMGLFVEKL